MKTKLILSIEIKEKKEIQCKTFYKIEIPNAFSLWIDKKQIKKYLKKQEVKK